MLHLRYKVINLNKQIGGGEKKNHSNVYQKGNAFWFSSKGKLILNSGEPQKAMNSIVKKVHKNFKKYSNKEFINIGIKDWKNNQAVLNPIEISVVIYKIVGNKDSWNIELRNNDNSYIRFFIKEKEFSHNYFKKLGKAVLEKKYEMGIDYTFEDIKKIL